MDSQTFIFVHDQKIVNDFIKSNKFNQISNLKYVFLGDGDTSEIEKNSSVIISKNLPLNIENFPKLTSFTGWYSMWKNKLYNSDYINLFEYDINLSHNFLDEQKKTFGVYDIIGYIPFNVHNAAFIEHRPWSNYLAEEIKRNYNVDIFNFISNLPKDKECSMTSNHTLSKNIFEQYMMWMEPMIDKIKLSELSGHQVERSISLFYLINNITYKVIPNVLNHFQFNSHQTQSIPKTKFVNEYHKLL